MKQCVGLVAETQRGSVWLTTPRSGADSRCYETSKRGGCGTQPGEITNGLPWGARPELVAGQDTRWVGERPTI